MTVETKNKTGGGAENNRDTLLALKGTKAPAIENYSLSPAGGAEPPGPAPGRPASQNIAAIRENVRDAWLLQAEIEKVGESIENPEPPAKIARRDAKLKSENDGLGRAHGAMWTIGAVAATALLLAGLARALRWKAHEAKTRQNSAQESTTATAMAPTNQAPSDGKTNQPVAASEHDTADSNGLSAIHQSRDGVQRL